MHGSFLSRFSVKTTVVFTFLILSFLRCLWAAHYTEEDIEKITRNVISLSLSTREEISPRGVMRYNQVMRDNGWNIQHSPHFKIATGSRKVLISQSKRVTDPRTHLDKSTPASCEDLRHSLAPYVSPAEFTAFAQKHHLHPRMPTIPHLFQHIYTHLTDDKQLFYDLVEAYRDPSRSIYAIAGRPIVSLLAITLKIKNPRMPVKLIIFGEIPDYTHAFLRTLRIPYENHPSPREGFPEDYERFMRRFSPRE